MAAYPSRSFSEDSQRRSLPTAVLFRPYGLIGRLQSTQCVISISATAIIAACVLLTAGSPFTALAIAAVPSLLYPHIISDFHMSFHRLCRRCGWNANAVLSVCFGIAVASAFFLGSTEAAHAAFYKNVEDWLGSNILKDQKNLVSLVINVLRAIFVVYVGIAVVSVVQKMQQGDDWQTAARIPLVVVVCAAMGDMLAGMIIGTGTGATKT